MSNSNNMMRNGGGSRSRPTENDQGTGPATPRSPASSANNDNELAEDASAGFGWNGDRGYSDLEREFHRRLAGMRSLCPHNKANAYKAAKDWYALALAQLRERRMYELRGRNVKRRLRRRSRHYRLE